MKSWSVPDHIESYRILEPLGQGGMGLVYEGVHEILGTRVAIKLAAPRVCEEPALRARFLNEARTLQELQHPGVVGISGCGEVGTGDKTIPYIVMELLQGRTLQQRIADGAMPIEEARRIGRQVAEILREVHRHGLVHRDLKPANIMLIENDASESETRVKLIDFGIAKVPLGLQAANSVVDGTELQTGDDTSLGTPAYMAPEQCKDASAVDAQSDAYALGVVLYEMLAGRPPFVATTRVELLTQHMRDQPPPLRRKDESIPQRVEQLVMGLLSKEPSSRPDLDTASAILGQEFSSLRSSRRWHLAAIGLPIVALGLFYLGRTRLGDWLVERELRGVQLEAGTIADAKRATARARSWVSILTVGHRFPLPLSDARLAHKEADVALQEGRIDDAKLGYTQALARYRSAGLVQTAAQPVLRDRIAACSNELAQAQRHLGNDQSALENLDQGIAEHDVLVRLPDNRERRQFLRTLVLFRRAELAAGTGDPQAAGLLAELHKILDGLHRTDPNNANVCWQLSRVLAVEAAVWARSGRGAEARVQAEQALSLVQEARRLAPAWRRPKIAEVEEARSEIYAALGDTEAAKAALHAAYSRWQETVAEEHRGAYLHAWLLVCVKGAHLQQGSMRATYVQTAQDIISRFERNGLYPGDVHVADARARLAALAGAVSPQGRESPGVLVPTR